MSDDYRRIFQPCPGIWSLCFNADKLVNKDNKFLINDGGGGHK